MIIPDGSQPRTYGCVYQPLPQLRILGRDHGSLSTQPMMAPIGKHQALLRARHSSRAPICVDLRAPSVRTQAYITVLRDGDVTTDGAVPELPSGCAAILLKWTRSRPVAFYAPINLQMMNSTKLIQCWYYAPRC
jgi:hypothetical protein